MEQGPCRSQRFGIAKTQPRDLLEVANVSCRELQAVLERCCRDECVRGADAEGSTQGTATFGDRPIYGNLAERREHRSNSRLFGIAGGEQLRSSDDRAPCTRDGVERQEPCAGPCMSTGYVELHAHSNYSFLDGASDVEELVTAAVELGMDALALTDTNGLYGAVRFWNAAKDACIRPLYGAEIQTLDFGHLVLIARDRIGWRSLCRTISAAQLAGEKTKPRATLALIAENAEGLFALTGCAYASAGTRRRSRTRAPSPTRARSISRRSGRAEDVPWARWSARIACPVSPCRRATPRSPISTRSARTARARSTGS